MGHTRNEAEPRNLVDNSRTRVDRSLTTLQLPRQAHNQLRAKTVTTDSIPLGPSPQPFHAEVIPCDKITLDPHVFGTGRGLAARGAPPGPTTKAEPIRHANCVRNTVGHVPAVLGQTSELAILGTHPEVKRLVLRAQNAQSTSAGAAQASQDSTADTCKDEAGEKEPKDLAVPEPRVEAARLTPHGAIGCRGNGDQRPKRLTGSGGGGAEQRSSQRGARGAATSLTSNRRTKRPGLPLSLSRL